MIQTEIFSLISLFSINNCDIGSCIKASVGYLYQRGPTSFNLRVMLQKRHNLRATSNNLMYKTTCSKDLKLKREDK